MQYGKQNNLNVTSIKKDERSIACNAIIKKEENGKAYFLLGLRAKHKSGGGQWGLVGGTQAVEETMQVTLSRELEEEINLKVDPSKIKWHNFFQCIAAPGVHFDHHGFVVDFNDCEGELKNMEPNKCDELRWFETSEIPFDNFFVSKGNLINYLNNENYNSKIDFDYRKNN